MKKLVKLTYNEIKIVSSWGLNPENWKKERIVGGYIYIRNNLTNEERMVPARVKER